MRMEPKILFKFFSWTLLFLTIVSSEETLKAKETQAQLPNILWIVAEDMSPHLGCYGHPDAHSPNIDALAKKGVVYQNAFATAPICAPARSTLATGLYATSLGTQHLRCEVKIPKSVVPLAIRMKQAGYFTTNTGKSDYNFNPKGIWDHWKRDAAPWRNRKPGQPFFSFINAGETHEGRINFIDRYKQATKELPASLKRDPTTITLPPFYPDTPEIRRIFAGMYDLSIIFDQKVGGIIKLLTEDGLLENTFVFIFSDHGNGLPRYKRWLNDSGLRVPLIIYFPERFKHLSPHPIGSKTDRLVSFVDFPATTLSLAGLEIPSILQGEPFMGRSAKKPRQYVFGARSRADDMFETSRSVFDGRYFYVKHFQPHLPYIQRSIVFQDQKSSLRELRKCYEAGSLDSRALKLWQTQKPFEELYDLKKDPHELNNLAGDSAFAQKKEQLSQALKQWIIDHRDSGLLTEAEYQNRAMERKVTPFEVVQDQRQFDLKATVEMAWKVGDSSISLNVLNRGLTHKESGVRYWSGVALSNSRLDELTQPVIQNLLSKLKDPSFSVRLVVCDILIRCPNTTESQKQRGLQALGEILSDDRRWLALEAASTVRRLGHRVKPLVPIIKKVIQKNESKPGSGKAYAGARRKYKDFNYASFTGWALEAAIKACGEN